MELSVVAENRFRIRLEGDLQLTIFETTQFRLEEMRKLHAELLAGLKVCMIGLVVLPDGICMITAGVDSWLS